MFKKLYSLYDNDEYYFLNDIGILHEIYNPYLEPYGPDTKKYQNLREILKKYLPVVMKEIEIVLAAIDSGKLKIINLDQYRVRYEIEPDIQEKLDGIKDQIAQVKKQNTPISSLMAKKWWNFW